MSPKVVTTKMIAEEVGVCQQIVSAVLNGNHKRVSQRTREKILATAKAMNYRSNQVAKMLRSGRSKFIGVLFASLLDRYFAEMLHFLERELATRGYIALLSNWETVEEFDRVLDKVIGYGVEGIITSHDNIARIPPGLPTVIYDYRLADRDSVEVDNRESFRELFHYLYGLGHRDFGFIGARENNVRYWSFRDCLQEHGLPIRPEWIFECGGYYQEGSRAAGHFLAGGSLPTAIMSTNDAAAIGAMAEFRRAGLKVPEELSLTGVDNILESAHVCPSITTIDLRIEESAAALVENLIGRLEMPESAYKHTVTRGKLVQRESCATPKNRTGNE